jgi:hypothetical protein
MLKQALSGTLTLRALVREMALQGWGLLFEFFIDFFILTIVTGSAPAAFILYFLWKVTVLDAIVDFFESIPYVGPFITLAKDAISYIIGTLHTITKYVLGSFCMFMVLVFVVTVIYHLNAEGHLDRLLRPK